MVTLFFILILEIIIAVEGLDDVLSMILSRQLQ